MQFAPSSGFTFTRSTINAKRGCIAPLSIVSIGAGRFVYLSEDGFFSGVEGTPIGAERVDRWFFANLNKTYLTEVRGVADPYEKIVWWSFKDTSGTSQLLGYDWQLDRWCYATNNIEELAAISTPALTWDGLATIYTSVDEADEPFNSRLFKGGLPTFAGFSTDHKLGYFTGPNRAAIAETNTIGLNGMERYKLSGLRVQTDATDFTTQVGKADFYGADIVWSAEITPSARTKFVGKVADGRIHRFRVNIPAGSIWETLLGISPEGEGSGI